ncbi:MAG: hypothetical protein Q9160_008695 [Pyrenula sp. 1 TL-2023]
MSLRSNASVQSASGTNGNDVAVRRSLVTSERSHRRNSNDPIATIVAGESPRNLSPPTDQDNVGTLISDQAVSAAEPEAPVQRPSGTVIMLTMTPLCLSVMLSALDLTIVTPAIPAIVGSFKSVEGYVWVGTAFILANTAITPVWGAVADIWGRKPILLLAMTVFLVGSLLCALAPNMGALIAGRTVQGLGSSGMGMMVNVIICDTFSLRDRGLYLAVTSIVWAVGSAVGPIIGVPIGGVVLVILLFFLKLPTPDTPVLAGLKAIDWTGSMLIVGAVLMVLLGLEFGDVTFDWSSATVICLILFSVVVLGIFVVNEWKFATNPVIPLRLFSSRSSIAAYGVYACNFYILIGCSYYLPLYSQSTLGADALTSGIHLLPLIVSTSLAAACSGAFIQKSGVYLPIMYIAQAMLTLGAGLFTTLHFGEGLAKLFIFEIITGIGVGMNIEPPLLAAQAAMTVLDTAAVNATMSFVRSIATAIAIVVAGVIFQGRMNAANDDLVNRLGGQLAGNFNGDNATANIELIGSLPTDQQILVRRTYFRSLGDVWVMVCNIWLLWNVRPSLNSVLMFCPLQFVVVAGVGLIMNLFVRAHHLSVETKTALLGVDRAKREGRQPNAQPQGMSVELQTPGG